MNNISEQRTPGFDKVNFTFTNNYPFDYTTDLFNVSKSYGSFGLFTFTGTMDINQWTQDSLVCPKLLKSIKILTWTTLGGVTTPSPSPLQNINIYYQNSEGIVYSFWKQVNTTIEPNQIQSNITLIDFDTKTKEFTLNSDTYIANYTFPAYSITTVNIEFQEMLNIEELLLGNKKGVIWNNQRELRKKYFYDPNEDLELPMHKALEQTIEEIKKQQTEK